MRSGEALSDDLTRLFECINQLKMYGEELTNKKIFRKLLISLTPQYDNVVYVIEGTKKISEIDPTEVVATFKDLNKG